MKLTWTASAGQPRPEPLFSTAIIVIMPGSPARQDHCRPRARHRLGWRFVGPMTFIRRLTSKRSLAAEQLDDADRAPWLAALGG
jgi:hypothetical protein